MSRPVRGGASYRAVLALPHARGLFAAAMLARLSYGLLSLPLLLSLRQGTGSYAVAGTAAGLFGLASALLGPARARLVERRPRALMLLACVYAGLLVAIAVAGRTGIAAWPAVALAGVAGVFPPPVGPLMRALWGVLAPDQQQRQRALSVDTVSESTVFAAGPALAGVLIGAWSAPLALTVCAGLVLVGFSALAAALRRVPRQLRPAHGAAGGGSVRSPLRGPGFVLMLLVVLGSACALAMDEIASLAVWGAGTAGSLLTVCSVGGALGGLAYGRRSWRSPLGRRLALLGTAAAVCFALPALLPRVPVAAIAFLGAGITADMLLITTYLLVDALVPDGSRVEAGAWVNTGYNLGASLGSACAGALLDGAGSRAVFVAAAAAAGLAAVTGAVTARAVAGGRGTVHAPPPGQAAPDRGPSAAGGPSGVHHGDLTEAEVLQRSGN